MIKRILPLLGLVLVCAIPGYSQTVVQATSNTFAFATTVTLTLNGVVTGNSIFCGVSGNNGAGAFSISDTVNTYNSVIPLIVNGGSSSFNTQGFLATNVTGGTLSIGITDAGGDRMGAACMEISGLSASPTDKTAGNNDNNGFGTALSSGATAATTQANEIVVGFGTGSGAASSSNLTAAGGYTIPANGASASATNNLQVAVEYLVVSSTGAQTATETAPATTRWNMGVVTLKKSVGGPAASVLAGPTKIAGPTRAD
jgi:hypothetical protein